MNNFESGAILVFCPISSCPSDEVSKCTFYICNWFLAFVFNVVDALANNLSFVVWNLDTDTVLPNYDGLEAPVAKKKKNSYESVSLPEGKL